MEQVRRETHLGDDFDLEAFDRAFRRFRELYGVLPLRAICAPGVLARYCEIVGLAASAHEHSLRLEFEGVPLVAAIVAPGTIVFEGEVDEDRMGDW